MESSKYGQYDRYEVISAWIKEMRLGNVNEAFYWLNVMLEAGESSEYIAKRLVIFSAEDAFDPQALQIGGAIAAASAANMLDSNWLWQGTYWMCKARKFWECPEGRDEYERTSHKVMDELAEGKRTECSEKKRPIPSYALDTHTRRGKAMARSGRMDDRFSGTIEGRKKMMANFERNGKLDVDDMTDLF